MMLPDIMMRTGVRQYYYGSLFAGMAAVFLAFFCPFLIDILINYACIPKLRNGSWIETWLSMGINSAGQIGNSVMDNEPFGWLYCNVPFLYCIVYAMCYALYSALMAGFAMAISFWVEGVPLVLLLPVYVLYQILDRCTLFLNEALAPKVIELNVLRYCMGEMMPGKSLLYLLLYVITISGVVVILTEIKTRQSQ